VLLSEVWEIMIGTCGPYYSGGSATKENWIWFMEQLGKALGPLDKLAMCTDACKGLEAAVKQVFPKAKQRECFMHLMDNMKKRFSQG
jgi:transposase-like protein